MLKLAYISTLSETSIKLLFQSGIITILDFLQEDVEKISNICKLNIPQVLEIRNQILTKYSAPVINGNCLFQTYLKNKNVIKFGIENLDNILPDGLPIGTITELCGLAGSGKTQLAIQITINCVKDSENTVLYVDTKGDFSSVRIQNILERQKYSFKDMASIMKKIHIVYIWTMEELVNLFKSLRNKELKLENLMFIVIDSLPTLMFQHLGEGNKLGLSLLNQFVNYSRFICRQLNVGILCINVQTRWIDQDLADMEDEGKSSAFTKDSYIEKRHRCLGKYWQHIPSLVIELEKMNEVHSETNSCLKMTVLHSTIASHENCNSTLTLDDSGVT